MFDISEGISDTFNRSTENKLDSGLSLVGFFFFFVHCVMYCNPLNAVNIIPMPSSPFGFVGMKACPSEQALRHLL